MSILSKIVQKATRKNAREMIIFSYPKIGKTEMCTKLPGSYVIFDFEGGTEFYDCNVVPFHKKTSTGEPLTLEQQVKKWHALKVEMEENNPKFDFIVIDTLTSLYSILGNALAVEKYNVENKKNRPLTWDVDELSYGGGQRLKRMVIQEIIQTLKQYCGCLIMLAHAADKTLGDLTAQLGIKDIALEGKLKDILALKTDAIGFLHRKEPNKNYLSFITEGSAIIGTRLDHLANKEFLISEWCPETRRIKESHWDKIFIK